MKKCPRWAATLAALTVILTSTLAPLEGAAAPGPIQLPEDPKYYFGDPDIPTNYSLRRVDLGLCWTSAIQLLLDRYVTPVATRRVRHLRGPHE